MKKKDSFIYFLLVIIYSFYEVVMGYAKREREKKKIKQKVLLTSTINIYFEFFVICYANIN